MILDRCPGVLDLHPGTDGGVARLRTPGGLLDRALLRGLADLADDLGSGFLDLTSRSNLQVRGVTDRAALVERCPALGLLPSPEHDRARTITMSPLSELADLVRELDRGICASPELAGLGGRFLFALDDGTGGSGLATSHVGARVVEDKAEIVLGGRFTGDAVLVEDLVEALCAHALDPVPGSGAVAEVPEQRLALGLQRGWTVAAARLGRLTAAQLRGLAERSDDVRVAAAGRVLVRGDVALDGLDLVTADGDPWAGVSACAGLGCQRATADVRALAQPVGAPVHWVGCDRHCGRPADAAVRVAR